MPEENDQPNEGEENTDVKSEELGDGGKKALDAERKARRDAEKAAKALQARLQELEDADKSEVEKLRGQVETLSKQAEAAQAKADRFEVAAAKGLSLAQARRLVGSTKEELEDDADAMRSELGLDKNEDESKDESKDEAKDEGGRPREDLRSGASNEDDSEPDPGKLADSILGSRF
jgi:hypothetical protein